MIRNLIFDFGGVILKHEETHNEVTLSKMFSISFEEAESLWAKYKADLLIGKESSRQFISKLKGELNSNLEIEELMRIWRDLYKKEADNVNNELLRLIEVLKKKYKVYLFSDTIEIHDEYNAKRGIYEKFHGVFKSFEEGYKKPDREACVNILEKISASPKECVFIDDLDENVQMATRLGLKGIRYKNLRQFKKELSRLGVSF
jgi:epoxide hydrolase-like predicted phosphatase